MILMSGINLPLWDVRKMIASTVHLIVHLDRMQDGTRKITYMTEIRGLDREEIAFNDLFLFRLEKIDEQGKVIGQLKPSIRYYPLFFHKLQKLNLISDKIFVSEL
jgi:pilus assembly protein CpaF